MVERVTALARLGYVITGLIMFLPQAQALLRLRSIPVTDMAQVLGLGACLVLLPEVCKVRT
jgi:hypothetical protein